MSTNHVAKLPSSNIASTVINWNLGLYFDKTVTTDLTFTFTNTSEKKIYVYLDNTSGSVRTMTFPTNVPMNSAVFTIPANKKAVFVFLRIDTTIYVSRASET